MKKNKLVLYLGQDGSYVLAKSPPVVQVCKFTVPDSTYDDRFLGTRRKRQLLDLGEEGALLFAGLRLKKFEVVRLDIRVIRTKKKKARKT